MLLVPLPGFLHVCRWTLLCQLISWFNAYCLVRTYSTSMEAMLTVVAAYWLLKANHRRQADLKAPSAQCGPSAWIAGAALCFVARPPSGLLWAGVALQQVLAAQSKAQAFKLIAHGVVLGGSLVGAATALDSAVYGRCASFGAQRPASDCQSRLWYSKPGRFEGRTYSMLAADGCWCHWSLSASTCFRVVPLLTAPTPGTGTSQRASPP